ncbi:MAG: MBOAT family protein [Eubacterium sp.]|nr:MBOAT family protein [Eubacterium sp.]
MLFNSLHFLIFFPVVTLVYFIIPKKLRYLWLLAASYYFYMCWNAKYALLIAFSTAVTWFSGFLLGKCPPEASGKLSVQKLILVRKLIVAVSFFVNLSILAFFKYFDFILGNLNWILHRSGLLILEKPFDFVLPVGISFYTFQALSYTVDVYRMEIEPERNILKYALFVSFFPQLVAGPIERSKNLLMQIQRMGELDIRQLFDYERIAGGLQIMLWGFFQKLVIADRIAILVNTVFDSWYFYGTVELATAAAAFSIQIYCDFASYSTIAVGAAKVLGVTLMENFNTPYFSCSIQDFWRRWHISLSTWLKDYLYIPLGGNRCGRLRQHFNIMLTFLVSGLWHGASWHYVVWGGMHGVFKVVGAQTRAVRDRFYTRTNTKTNSFSFRLGQAAATSALAAFAWIFFRADSFTQACGYVKRLFTKPNLWALSDGTLYQLGLDQTEMNILLSALMILLFFSIVKYKRKEDPDAFLANQCAWFRWMTVAVLFSFIFLFGIYGPGYDAAQFIYFQF